MPQAIQKPERGTARDSLIRVGVELCTQAGFQATGVEQVLRGAGVPKGSFYHYFPSKKEFGLAVIDAYAEYFCTKLQRLLENPDVAPLERLRSFVAEAERGMEKHQFQRGCLVGNLGQEMAGLDDEFRERLEAVLKLWQAQTSRCLKAAQEAGELNAALDADGLAEFFWIGWEGAILRAKLTRSSQPMRAFADGFFAYLGR
ncbi:TetR family transcriptional regulator [Pusillimonas sp. TS35]|uniref:acrylate utilization transcriptional regulator AcuR n=1 Tax=Paracandidimonas lactea TaxID=2895524 RepID=UPI001370C6E1|nr:TetR/AcrR family transcriptional regulator [Paracandidimonas lactea]MYN13856.1 TetR family transcriptional regulator [Pusillimonas sp. TS35]